MSLRPEVVKDTYYYLADISKNKSKLSYVIIQITLPIVLII